MKVAAPQPKPEWVPVTLNENECQIARMVGERVFQQMNRGDYPVGQIGVGHDRLRQCQEGFAAEIAYCKHHNTFPDFSDEPSSVDVVTPDGFTVDVKRIAEPELNLVVPIHTGKSRKKTCAIYALVYGSMPDFWIVGEMLGGDVVQDDNVHDIGHGPSYVVDQSSLVPVARPETQLSMGCWFRDKQPLLPMFDKLLYDNRSDLWAVSRVLTHCRQRATSHIRARVWSMLSEPDQVILLDLQKNIKPEKWCGHIKTNNGT